MSLLERKISSVNILSLVLILDDFYNETFLTIYNYKNLKAFNLNTSKYTNATISSWVKQKHSS